MREGTTVKVSGFVVAAEGIENPIMNEVVLVGESGLIGEINKIDGNRVFIQVYEDTSGLKNGDKIVALGSLLSAELGPGMLGNIYDGLQRPLREISTVAGGYIRTGVKVKRLEHGKLWRFVPIENPPAKVYGGEIVGSVKENDLIEHMILVPPNVKGNLTSLKKEGDYNVIETVAIVENSTGKFEIKMTQEWPVKVYRPFIEKLDPKEPLITGVRVIDFFFPIAKGGTACIPGPFGSGKTVTMQQVSKQADADVLIYVGCGERGNEMADLLSKYKTLSDLRSNIPLLQRSIIIANTSNMPVAAREASIFLGITMAEYFRDMGYQVALIADSTSRWAEALRELSSRMEELPGEEGFPAYLSSKLQSFYSRAGTVKTLNGRTGSVTIMGAISPPGGDFSEPVTQKTLQSTKVFWGLDFELAYKRHYPAINWLQSYSLYVDNVALWWELKVNEKWRRLRDSMLSTLKEEDELMQLVRLVGSASLNEKEKAVLEIARIIREVFLQQNALDINDAYCSPEKVMAISDVINYFKEQALEAVSNNIRVEEILKLNLDKDIGSFKALRKANFQAVSFKLKEKIAVEMSRLPKMVKA